MDNESVRTAPAIVFLVMGLFYHMGESAPSVQPIRITGRVLENRLPFAGARIELYPGTTRLVLRFEGGIEIAGRVEWRPA